MPSMAESATQTVTIEAPVAHCFAIATDFEHYPEWAHDVKEARIKESDDIPSAILDFLWEIHRSKVFVATVELWVAARTDPVLAVQVQQVEPVVIAAVLASVAQMLPDEAGRRDLRHATYTAMDAMRGLMLWKFVDGDDERLQRRWMRARARLRSDIEKALSS